LHEVDPRPPRARARALRYARVCAYNAPRVTRVLLIFLRVAERILGRGLGLGLGLGGTPFLLFGVPRLPRVWGTREKNEIKC